MGGVLDYSGVLDMLDKVDSINDSDAWLFALSQDDVRREIVRLNTEDQLFENGIDSTGNFITNQLTGSSTYAPFTIKVKQKTGLPYDRITLFQTGRYYGTYRVTYDAESFTIDANGDVGDKNLFDVYGEDILGLTDFNMERVKVVILQYYVKWLEDRLFR
tara:strand:+ start:2444 stop:2923 length:480 start_codon:yes stop_codon:yes gene_type:complete